MSLLFQMAKLLIRHVENCRQCDFQERYAMMSIVEANDMDVFEPFHESHLFGVPWRMVRDQIKCTGVIKFLAGYVEVLHSIVTFV